MSRRIFLLLVINVVFTATAAAGAFDAMEKVVMPGKLIEGHAKYEDDCDKCHKSFDKAAQSRLCKDCHKKINIDLKDRKGFHGRSKTVPRKACRVCHTDHTGRKADIMLLDKDTFDHNFTDFPLRGGHASTKCANCHKKDKKRKTKSMHVLYRNAPSKCAICHKTDEPHKGRLGKVCDICHLETAWNDFYFNHEKTEFPLKGKHQGVGCTDCHPTEQYKNVPNVCYGCHKLDDNHKGAYSRECKKCHAPKGWALLIFNHDKDTKFKLKAKHLKVTCGQCHKGKYIYKEKLKKDCFQCHKLDDVHKGRNGKKCEDCHTAKGFAAKTKFDHDKTDFALRGKHKDVNCKDCHRGEIKGELSLDCFECHRQDDAHKGQQGRGCVQCHEEKGWNAKVVFDHALSIFPLLGVHGTLACEQCHVTRSFKDADERCAACHAEDDHHKRTLGPRCEGCHNASDWKAWKFDHDKQTEFKLDGAHKGIVCKACHKIVVKDKIKMIGTCYDCHSGDDAHASSFGRFCERCHNTKKFTELKSQFSQ